MNKNEPHILITGGSGKVGSAIVEAFLEKNIKVTNVSKSGSMPKIKNKLDKNLFCVKLDVTDEKSFSRFMDKLIFSRGIVTSLINCCSYRPMIKGFEDDIENWKKSILDNSLALFVPSRICAKHMAKNQTEGSIITISSIYGLVAPQFGIYEGFDFISEPDYSYNKHASIGFTKYLASYYAKDGIRANVIAPGGFKINQPEAFLQRYNDVVPQKRMAYSSDIKGLVTFLASNESRYITGTVIPLDGGWTTI